MTIKTKKPKISVVMPIYNCAKYLDEAMSSVLLQTYDNFEIIAINDGSKDDSLKILKKYAKNDNRIRIINQKNSGIVKTLNRGILEARGEYIARMDGDDVCFLNRFADQVKILDKNKKIILVAGNFEIIDENSEFLYRELAYPDNENLQRALYLRNPIAHGSTMFRRSAVIKVSCYSDKCGPTEDFDLWMRLSKEGKFAATASPLYKWRMNQSGLTLSKNDESIAESKKHIEKRWQEGRPARLSRREILSKANYYYKNYKKHGVYYKESFLIDTSQIAVKFISHGYWVDGFLQLLACASTGRTGLKTVLKRITLVGRGRFDKFIKFVNPVTDGLN